MEHARRSSVDCGQHLREEACSFSSLLQPRCAPSQFKVVSYRMRTWTEIEGVALH